MTSDADARQDHEHLFLADFYPELGEYLAGQCAAGYDARAGRARFRAWLIAHAEQADHRGSRGSKGRARRSSSPVMTTRTCPPPRCRSRAPPPTRLRTT